MFENGLKNSVFNQWLQEKMILSRKKLDILGASETSNKDNYVADNFSTTWIKIDALNQWLSPRSLRSLELSQ